MRTSLGTLIRFPDRPWKINWPFFKLPWYTRIYVSCPKRPSSSLNARATRGAAAAGTSSTGGALAGCVVSCATISRSAGLARYAQTPSRSGCTAVFFIAEPRKTGENFRDTAARRIAAASCALDGSASFKKSSAISSSTSASCSINSCLF